MLLTLKAYGSVECNSPKNRYRLERLLLCERTRLRWYTVFVGHTEGAGRDICPWRPKSKFRPNITPRLYAQWIVSKRLSRPTTPVPPLSDPQMQAAFAELLTCWDDVTLTRLDIQRRVARYLDSVHFDKWHALTALRLRKTVVQYVSLAALETLLLVLIPSAAALRCVLCFLGQ